MADEIGLFASIWRFFTFYKLRKSLGIARAADAQFTGSADGIRDAFDIYKDKVIRQFNEMRDAVAEVEAVLENKRMELERLNKREEEVLVMRDGALDHASRAKEAGDNAGYEKHAQAFERFENEVAEIEARQGQLDAELKETSGTMEKYMLRLREMSAEVEKLPQQKAEAIATHVSSKKMIELSDRLKGLQSSMDRGPIEAVLEANRQLTARAKITDKLAGVDAKVAEKEYAQAGRRSTARDKLDQMMAAKKAEKAGGVTAEKKEEDRPKI